MAVNSGERRNSRASDAVDARRAWQANGRPHEEATDTIGNAKETAEWAKQHDFKRIIVVTSDFHMARSLTELRMAMPKVEFVPHAVRTLNGEDWWRNKRALRRLGVEYVKVVAANGRALGDWLNPFNDAGK